MNSEEISALDRPGGAEKVFWALAERYGARQPRDVFLSRDLFDLIVEGRLGDAYIVARQYDRYTQWLERAQAAMNEEDPLKEVLDAHGCLPARPEPIAEPPAPDEAKHEEQNPWGDE